MQILRSKLDPHICKNHVAIAYEHYLKEIVERLLKNYNRIREEIAGIVVVPSIKWSTRGQLLVLHLTFEDQNELNEHQNDLVYDVFESELTYKYAEFVASKRIAGVPMRFLRKLLLTRSQTPDLEAYGKALVLLKNAMAIDEPEALHMGENMHKKDEAKVI